jgi:N-acetylglucosamine-6-sulfatase
MSTSLVRTLSAAVGAVLAIALVVTLVITSSGPGSQADPDAPTAAPTTTVPPAPEPTESGQPAALPDQPNVVVVMADDMRVDDLEFAPHLRRLVAEQGVTFENSFSPFPLCCPARASFLTGQYAHNHKVFWHEPPFGYGAFDDSRTLATALQDAGYRTGFIGKYLNRYGIDDSKVTGAPSYSYVPEGWTDWRGSGCRSRRSR